MISPPQVIFEGEDVSMTLSKVLQREPDLDAWPPDAPPAVVACLRRCLQKDPKQRVRDMGDVRLGLAGAFDSSVRDSPAVIAPTTPVAWRRLVPWAAGAMAGGLVVGAFTWGGARSRDLYLFNGQDQPGGEPLLETEGDERRVSLSPDGRWLAFDSDESGSTEVYVRAFPDLQSGKWQISSGGGEEPRWSPDSKSLYYLGPDGLMVARLDTTATFGVSAPEILFARPTTRFPHPEGVMTSRPTVGAFSC
jgi:hypothetical protein